MRKADALVARRMSKSKGVAPMHAPRDGITHGQEEDLWILAMVGEGRLIPRMQQGGIQTT